MKKILKPNKIIAFIFFNLGMGLLTFVFSYHLEDTPLAYLSYLLSSYALIIFCIWFYESCKSSRNFITKNSKIYKIYNIHHQKVTKLSLLFSLSLNLIYGLFKLISGIYYKSEWFITFGVYYILLCFMKSSLIINVKNTNFGENLTKELEKLKHTGIILLFLDLILMGMIILIIHQNNSIIYPGYLIYIVALYDFYLIINAIIKVFKSRKLKSPILIASKCINLTVAMISLISLEVAMIYQFGNNDESFKIIMLACTGFGVSLINSGMSIYLIVKGHNELKSLAKL